jgi:hypothetical protein
VEQTVAAKLGIRVRTSIEKQSQKLDAAVSDAGEQGRRLSDRRLHRSTLWRYRVAHPKARWWRLSLDAVARVCVLADCQPYPYGKWLLRSARESRIGATIVPVLETVASSISELTERPTNVSFREWQPIARLRQLRSVLPEALGTIGWNAPWVTDLKLNVPWAFSTD